MGKKKLRLASKEQGTQAPYTRRNIENFDNLDYLSSGGNQPHAQLEVHSLGSISGLKLRQQKMREGVS